MNTAVVYYSNDGSTRAAAVALAERLDADIYELKEVRPRSKTLASFMTQGLTAILGLKSRVQDTFKDRMDAYGRICIGTPIWASRPVPAANTFVHALNATDKQVLLFTVQADPNPQDAKGTERICGAIRKKGGMLLPVLQLHGEAPGKTATKEHINAQLEQKLGKVLHGC